MAIKFNVLEIGKPGDPAAPKKFYPRQVTSPAGACCSAPQQAGCTAIGGFNF